MQIFKTNSFRKEPEQQEKTTSNDQRAAMSADAAVQGKRYPENWRKAFTLAENVRFTRTPDSAVAKRPQPSPARTIVPATAAQANTARMAKGQVPAPHSSKIPEKQAYDAPHMSVTKTPIRSQGISARPPIPNPLILKRVRYTPPAHIALDDGDMPPVAGGLGDVCAPLPLFISDFAFFECGPFVLKSADVSRVQEKQQEKQEISNQLEAEVQPQVSVAEMFREFECNLPHANQPSSPSTGPVVQAKDERPAIQQNEPVKAIELEPAQKEKPANPYQFPMLDLLQLPVHQNDFAQNTAVSSQDALERVAGLLENVLEDFGVKGEITAMRSGPVVTSFEFELADGVKASRIIALSEDIARAMCIASTRVAVISGRNAVCIELAAPTRESIYLRDVMQSRAFREANLKLPLALGKNTDGKPVSADLAKMPHLFMAGEAGAGQSVALNAMIVSLLCRMTPQQCRFIMVDPEMSTLSVYDGIPHLLTPVVTDLRKAMTALQWAVQEMEERYRKQEKGEQGAFPYIVIVINELASLMAEAGQEVEDIIEYLARMAHAVGIHLIAATEHPSADVVNDSIQAAFSTRISFSVASKVDSRTILGGQGAEQLLGEGDMLFMSGHGSVTRVHGAFVSASEVKEIASYCKKQGAPAYLDKLNEETVTDIFVAAE